MEKGSKGLIIILILLVLGLSGYIIYDKYDKVLIKEEKSEKNIVKEETKQEENEVIEKSSYKYSEIKGLYEGYYENWKLTLYLEEDGTFVYDANAQTHASNLGNYIIEDNQIKLNSIFWEGNGAGLGIEKKENHLILLKINNNGSLTEVQNKTKNREKETVLTKIETTEDYSSGTNNFYNKINNTQIYNNSTNN